MNATLTDQAFKDKLDCVVKNYKKVDTFHDKTTFTCILIINNSATNAKWHAALDDHGDIFIDHSKELEPTQYWSKSLKWFDSESEAERDLLYAFVQYKRNIYRYNFTEINERKITFHANKEE